MKLIHMANKKQKAIITPEDSFLNLFYETLFHKKRVKLTGIGIFTLIKVKDRVVEKHPKTGERCFIPAHYRVGVNLSKTLKRKLKDYEQSK